VGKKEEVELEKGKGVVNIRGEMLESKKKNRPPPQKPPPKNHPRVHMGGRGGGGGTKIEKPTTDPKSQASTIPGTGKAFADLKSGSYLCDSARKIFRETEGRKH